MDIYAAFNERLQFSMWLSLRILVFKVKVTFTHQEFIKYIIFLSFFVAVKLLFFPSDIANIYH